LQNHASTYSIGALSQESAQDIDSNNRLYNDKRDPTDVARQFEFMLSYSEALPARLPQFYNYLLRYPNGVGRRTVARSLQANSQIVLLSARDWRH
jgi:hypothetical protein